MKSTRDNRRAKETAVPQSKKVVPSDEAARIRAAFGDLTNASKNAAGGKKEVGKKARVPAESKVKVQAARTKPSLAQSKAKKLTTAPTATTTTSKAAGSRLKQPVAVRAEKKREVKKDKVEEEPAVASSQESLSSLSPAASSSHNLSEVVMSDLDMSVEEKNHSRMSLDQSLLESSLANQEHMPVVPEHLGIDNVDAEDQEDVYLVSLYVYDIFKYYKKREESFRLTPYLATQPEVTQRMRAVLVDWLVEVQENFELNHETLYLAVKLIDTYMSTVPNMRRENVQLLGAVALFLASKFDERMPPAIDDFIYICDHAYDREQFMAMERELFRTVGFDLGRPISYRFLRRYAKCARSETKTLYLARYILEFCLMEYKLAFQRDSLLAACVLYIARMMREEGGWSRTLEYYTGYKVRELKPLVLEINQLFNGNHYQDLRTVREKYQHHLFLSVAKIPFLCDEEIFPSPVLSKKPLPQTS